MGVLKTVSIAAIGAVALFATTQGVVSVGEKYLPERARFTSAEFSPVDKALECAEVPRHVRTELASAYSRDLYTYITAVPADHTVKVVVVNMAGHGCLILPGDPLPSLPKDKILMVAPAAGYVESPWVTSAKYYVLQEMEPQEGDLKRVYRIITLPRSSAPDVRKLPPPQQQRGPLPQIT